MAISNRNKIGVESIKDAADISASVSIKIGPSLSTSVKVQALLLQLRPSLLARTSPYIL